MRSKSSFSPWEKVRMRGTPLPEVAAFHPFLITQLGVTTPATNE